MSTTPTANTLFPPAIRAAKLLGGLGSAYVAASYLSSGTHLVPSLSHITTGHDLALTLHKLNKQISRPLLIIASGSSVCLAYIAQYLRSTPALTIPIASISLTQGSFLPHMESTHVTIGEGWEFFAAAAALMGAIVPWQLLGVGKVEKRICDAGDAIKAADEKGINTAVVTKEAVDEDAKRWKRGQTVSGAMAATATVLAAYAAHYW